MNPLETGQEFYAWAESYRPSEACSLRLQTAVGPEQESAVQDFRRKMLVRRDRKPLAGFRVWVMSGLQESTITTYRSPGSQFRTLRIIDLQDAPEEYAEQEIDSADLVLPLISRSRRVVHARVKIRKGRPSLVMPDSTVAGEE